MPLERSPCLCNRSDFWFNRTRFHGCSVCPFTAFITLVAADGIIMSGKEEETAGSSGKEPKISSHAPDVKGAIGGHAVKTETTSTPPQGETGAIINELISAMTQAFKQSSDKPSSSDSIRRNVALKQPKPYSLGQNFKV